jgi:uncharacterized short protein YbdD (DUF466 family)
MAALGRVLRFIAGAPDYERYLAHMRECHPEDIPLSHEEFTRQRMADRYEKPGSRCC